MDKKTKQIVGIVGATVGVSVIGIFGYWYYKKAKEQAKIDEMIEEGEKDMVENYQTDDRPRLSKLSDAIVNKLFPKDYKILPRTQRDIEKDMEEYKKQHRRRNRLRVYDNRGVSDRFKVMETMGDKGVEVRGTDRFRVSGNIHKRTAGGYGRNMNNRNANFSDLDIY